MVKKIRLLILVKSIDGGTGTFVINFLKIKNTFKRDALLIKTLVLERPTFRNVDGYKFQYFRQKNFYPQKYSLSPINFLNFFKEIAWIGKKVDKYKPSIILSIDLRCNLLAILLNFLSSKKIKIIATNHIDLGPTIFDKSTKEVGFFLGKAIKIFYDRADRIVCVSKRLSIKLKRDFNLQSEVLTVYNGQNFNIQKPKNFSSSRRKTILTIARLVEQKDYPTLIRAFRLLLGKFPHATLWIASDGPNKARLQVLVKRLNLWGRIKFLGWVDNINSYLRRAHVFVLASKREGFGYVLIEAMSQGIPVVSTDSPFGPSEILDDGKYGLLTPTGDSKSLKTALFELLSNKKKYEYFAKMSIKRCTFFSREKMLQGYRKMITGLS